ncbi:MAG: chemotaxis protein CheB, partial [Nitrospiraceae bacterium]|nr:chemotaxis protein CheB [Nitrospiraceae bacterium]
MPSRRKPTVARAKQRRQSAVTGQAHPPIKSEEEDRPDDRRNRMLIIVGIGASAGGLEAFTQLLEHLPLDTGMAFVLVQHLDPDHESALTHILSRATRMPVGEITHNQPLKANHVYVIPRDTNLSIVKSLLKLEPRARTRTPHRPIDTFFESLAQDQRERAIGVVLSGTASDGTLGLEAIKAEGGFTFAQDDSAKYDSMPRSAVAAGCVDLVLSPGSIAKELMRIATHPFVAER